MASPGARGSRCASVVSRSAVVSLTVATSRSLRRDALAEGSGRSRFRICSDALELADQAGVVVARRLR